MSKRSTTPGVVIAVVLAAAAIAAFKRRPVKPPQHSGTWAPADSRATRR